MGNKPRCAVARWDLASADSIVGSDIEPNAKKCRLDMNCEATSKKRRLIVARSVNSCQPIVQVNNQMPWIHPESASILRYVAEPDSEPLTVVNFKAFTQSIPDPEKRLFSFVIRKLKPRSFDEAA